MKTGIILEIDEHFLTVLTPDGQFLRAKNIESPYQIGEEIQFVPVDVPIRIPLKWYSTAKGKALAAAALAIMIGASTFIPIYESNQVYAYMTIDDGSSIELEVNKELEVIGMNPYNDEGQKIVNSIKDWKKQEVSIVSEKIITEMEKQKVGDGNIVMSSTILADETETGRKQKFNQEMIAIQTSVKEEHQATITHVEGTEAEREKAKEQGVTVGQIKEKEMSKNAKEKQHSKKSKNGQNQKNEQNIGPGNVEVDPNLGNQKQDPNAPEMNNNNDQKNNQNTIDNKQKWDKTQSENPNSAPQNNGQNKNQQNKQNLQKQNFVQQKKQDNPNAKGNQK